MDSDEYKRNHEVLWKMHYVYFMRFLLSNTNEALDDHRAIDYVIHVPGENIDVNEVEKVVVFEFCQGCIHGLL